jgi:mono/diheme cytochrome c family protein
MIHKFTFKSCLAFLIFLSTGIFQTSSAQPDGEALFKANCVACHVTGDAKVIGPGLKDIHKRRTEAWLIPWIKNSQAVIKSGDAYAVKLFEEYNKAVMTSFTSLKDDEIKAILAYVKVEGEKAPAAPVAGAPVAGGEAAKDTGFPWLLLIVVVLLIVIYNVLTRAKKGLEQVVRTREGLPEPVVLTGKAGRKHWIRENKKLIALILIVGAAWSSYAGWYALAD